MNDTAIDVIRLAATAQAGHQALAGSSCQQLYDSLPVIAADQSIRLLDLDALPRGSTINTNSVPLTGTLRVVSLKSSPSFAALSYVWGGYSPPKPDVLRIRLDNGISVKIDITTNCRDALLALRERYGAICIWIDAICINQVDQVEKASQLMLMGDIYTWAEMVYVWLGPETAASRKAFQWLSIFSQYTLCLDIVAVGSAVDKRQVEAKRRKLMGIILRRFVSTLWKCQLALTYSWLSLLTFWRGNTSKRMWKSFLNLFLAAHSRLSTYMASFSGMAWGLYGFLELKSVWTKDFDFLAIDLTDITERPWFKRGWTFQEIVLASDVTVMCGSSTLRWDVLIRGLSQVIRPTYIQTEWFFEFSNSEAKQTLAGLINIWMHLDRPTNWNGIRTRRMLRGKTTMDGYQQRGQDSLTNLTCLIWFSLLRLFFLFMCWLYHSLNFLLFIIIIGIGPAFSKITWPPNIGCIHWSSYNPFSNRICLEIGRTTSTAVFMQIAYIVLIWCLVSGSVALVLLFVTNATRALIWHTDGQLKSPLRWWDLSGYYQWTIRGKFGVEFANGDEPSAADIPVNGVIHALRSRQTTDAKDRSYAAYAVLSRLGVKPADPDYSKHLGLVYKEHFEQLILWNPGLLNLIIDVNGQQLVGAPSWVPNWTIAAKTSWLGSPEVYDMTKLNRFSFSIPQPSIPQLQGMRLCVVGQEIGTVTHSSGGFATFGPELELEWSQWERSCQKDLMAATLKFADWVRYIKGHVSTTPRYELSIPQLVSRVLSLHYLHNEPARFIRRPVPVVGLGEGEEAIALNGEKFDTWYRSVSNIPSRPLKRAMRLIAGDIDEILFGQIFTSRDMDCRFNDVIRELTVQFSNMLAGKRNVFVTNHGFVGSGCDKMQKNDYIYWIDGVSVPMALRRTRSSTDSSIHFTVVGPVYIYGLMGEDIRDENQLVSITLI